MGHLDKLKVSKRIILAARPRHRSEKKEHRRAKLIASLEEQIELAEMALQGKHPELKRKRGHNVVTVRPRLWWRDLLDGGVCTQIRYNRTPLNLKGRGTTIEVGSLDNLPETYRAVIKAVEAGELDRAMERVAPKTQPPSP